MTLVRLASIAVCLCLCACAAGTPANSNPPGVVCTMEARSSFAIVVADSVSGQKLNDATVRVTDGSFSATLTAPLPGDSTYSGVVYERPGTYAVSVTRAGYQPWQRSGVQVGRDECHVITQRLTARLRAAY